MSTSRSYSTDLRTKNQVLLVVKFGKGEREGQEKKTEPAATSGFEVENYRFWERRQELGPTSLLGFMRGTGENVSIKVLSCVMNETSLEFCFAL